MTAERVFPLTTRAAGWSGRASQHRRLQVRSRASRPSARVNELWASVVEVLEAVQGTSAAALCTADGASVATYGLSRTDQLQAPHEARHIFESHRQDAEADPASSGPTVATAEVTTGEVCTVVAMVPSSEHGDHLLLVSAAGVSQPLLHAWTVRAAEDLREILSAGD